MSAALQAARFTVRPLSPLFATLGLSAINTSLPRLMNESFGMRGIMPPEIIIVVKDDRVEEFRRLVKSSHFTKVKEIVAERFAREAPHLRPLPASRFDTAYRKGSWAYLEFATAGELTRAFGKTADAAGRSWFHAGASSNLLNSSPSFTPSQLAAAISSTPKSVTVVCVATSV